MVEDASTRRWRYVTLRVQMQETETHSLSHLARLPLDLDTADLPRMIQYTEEGQRTVRGQPFVQLEPSGRSGNKPRHPAFRSTREPANSWRKRGGDGASGGGCGVSWRV